MQRIDSRTASGDESGGSTSSTTSSRSKLDNNEIGVNLSLIEGDNSLLNDALVLLEDYVPTPAQIAAIQNLLITFTQEHGITLNNLRDDGSERTKLLRIIKFALGLPATEINSNLKVQRGLLKWKSQLYHAVAGQGEHVNLHNQRSSGMISYLLNETAIPPESWGTDLDVENCLGIKKNPEVQRAGTYILLPVSLTEDELYLFDRIKTALRHIQERKVKGRVSLRIPVNCGNNHWRLAKCEIEDGVVVSATLWDSLDVDIQAVKAGPAFKNFAKAIQALNSRIRPQMVAAKIQENDYSCMDFCLQAAYRDAGVDNAIVRAGNDPDVLRLAVVKQLVSQHAQLGNAVAARLVMREDGSIATSALTPVASLPNQLTHENEQKNIEALLAILEQKIKQPTKENLQWQIRFDGIFSNYLQELYSDKKTAKVSDEKILIDQARIKAIRKMRELGFFSTVTNTDKGKQPLEEPQQTPQI